MEPGHQGWTPGPLPGSVALMLDERRGFLLRKQVQICREPPKGRGPFRPKEARLKATPPDSQSAGAVNRKAPLVDPLSSAEPSRLLIDTVGRQELKHLPNMNSSCSYRIAVYPSGH